MAEFNGGPPVSTETEAVVLATLLQGYVKPEPRTSDLFGREHHRRILAAAERIRTRGGRLDESGLLDELHAAGELEDAGGQDYVLDLLRRADVIGHADRVEELRQRARRRQLYEIARRMQTAAGDPNQPFPGITSVARLELEELEREEATDVGAPPFRSLAEILADPAALEPPPVVARRFAYRGRSTLLAAREKLGKSTLLRGLMASVSRGTVFLDGRSTLGSGLYVAIEEHVGDVARGLMEFGADPERVSIMTPEAFRGRDPIAAIRDAVASLKPDIVGVDTLAALTSLLVEVPEAGNSSQWTPIMTRLTAIARDFETALLILHHARKSDGKYRDSSAIGGGVDAILEMQEGTDAGTRKVEGRGRWPIEPFTFSLRGNRFEVVGGELNVETKVLLHVERNPGSSQRDVERGVTGRTKDIRESIQALLSSGAIEDRGDRSTGRRLHVRGGASRGASGGFGDASGKEGGRDPRNSAPSQDGRTPDAPSGRGGSEGASRTQTLVEGSGTHPDSHPAEELELEETDADA